eukprot:TRINITY_DN5075_c0_g1_i1.p1 TRINITY_DN5075_c0_g1~~TRINITY_DN5075_c0_g1_i1.p1  ORF type:complete len:452 (-),score=86.21 TRINITY_DN5075_c0_g1_i1:308-1663(-)
MKSMKAMAAMKAAAAAKKKAAAKPKAAQRTPPTKKIAQAKRAVKPRAKSVAEAHESTEKRIEDAESRANKRIAEANQHVLEADRRVRAAWDDADMYRRKISELIGVEQAHAQERIASAHADAEKRVRAAEETVSELQLALKDAATNIAEAQAQANERIDVARRDAAANIAEAQAQANERVAKAQADADRRVSEVLAAADERVAKADAIAREAQLWADKRVSEMLARCSGVGQPSPLTPLAPAMPSTPTGPFIGAGPTDSLLREASRALNAQGHAETLNVAQGADLAAVRKAYYNLARMFHPDKLGPRHEHELAYFRAALDKVQTAYTEMSQDRGQLRVTDKPFEPTGVKAFWESKVVNKRRIRIKWDKPVDSPHRPTEYHMVEVLEGVAESFYFQRCDDACEGFLDESNERVRGLCSAVDRARVDHVIIGVRAWNEQCGSSEAVSASLRWR